MAFNEVKIGNQIWMSENLNVNTFRNGDLIPESTGAIDWEYETPCWCYYNCDPANEHKYGKLYNQAVLSDHRGIAPEGWHVPTLEEWDELIGFLSENSATKIKSKSGWSDYSIENEKGLNSGNGTDLYGFNALPGGYRDTRAGNSFVENWNESLGLAVVFWTGSYKPSKNTNIKKYIQKYLSNDSAEINEVVNLLNRAGYIRCIKDR